MTSETKAQIARISKTSTVSAGQEEVWQFVTSPSGFTYELGPWWRMTIPEAFAKDAIHDVTSGTFMGRSVVKFLRIIPVDRSDITVEDLDPPNRIAELHVMRAFSRWHQVRTFKPAGPEGTTITDEIVLQVSSSYSRIPGFKRWSERRYVRSFEARHHRLRKHFASKKG